MKTIIKESFNMGELNVGQTAVFLSSDSSLLVSLQHGTTLCMDFKCAQDFLNENITDDLAFVLVQRGLASYCNSRPISERNERVLPNFFLIDLTKRCNLQCVYCFRELDRVVPAMDKNMLSKICDKLIEYCQDTKSDRITIQPWGGEPLLEFDSILFIRRRFSEAGLRPRITIETNSTLITPQKARILYENNIDIGVSVDGCSDVHNSQRPFEGGCPSLQSVECGVLNLREAGYQSISSISVVTKQTLKYLDSVISYFANELKLDSIKLNLMRKTNRNRNLALDIDEIPYYVDKLVLGLRKCYENGNSIVEQNISQRLCNLEFRLCNNICNAFGCHGGYRMLSIDRDGYVYPCELSDDANYRVGHISDASFSEMVVHAIESGHEYFAARDTNGCIDCPWFYYCRGGCRAAVKYDCNDPTRIDKTECAFNKAMYPKLVEILLTDSDFAYYLRTGGRKE